ncbi:hypothetical protein NDN08_004924 [Rhodosorus marinus]|uniref:Uncharacterized protein n=1 Tax=Rhodosorus marinus TaxID=101924 RepID=A0AAV8UF40_9RHOD|nr:hypothetical protein NDN08_004924 [Rhodosorus marinus]
MDDLLKSLGVSAESVGVLVDGSESTALIASLEETDKLHRQLVENETRERSQVFDEKWSSVSDEALGELRNTLCEMDSYFKSVLKGQDTIEAKIEEDEGISSATFLLKKDQAKFTKLLSLCESNLLKSEATQANIRLLRKGQLNLERSLDSEDQLLDDMQKTIQEMIRAQAKLQVKS